MKIFLLILHMVGGFALSCGTEADPSNSPGTCRKSCESTRLANKDMRIRFLSPSDISLNCYGNVEQAYQQSLPIRFVIEKKYTALPAEAGTDGSSSGSSGGSATGGGGEVGLWQPVSGISFYPLLMQGQGGNTNSDPRPDFQGVETVSDEWCTDTCGVGSLNIRPLCRSEANTMKLGIFSGSLSGVMGITMDPGTVPTTPASGGSVGGGGQ